MEPEAAQNIIVADDDPFVRETLEIALAGAGHSVRATAHGREALRWLDDEPCHLLFMDLKMPEIDGPALYADLGPYHDDPMLRGVPVLFKPFILSDLFSAVYRALVPSSHVGL